MKLFSSPCRLCEVVLLYRASIRHYVAIGAQHIISVCAGLIMPLHAGVFLQMESKGNCILQRSKVRLCLCIHNCENLCVVLCVHECARDGSVILCVHECARDGVFGLFMGGWYNEKRNISTSHLTLLTSH